MRAYGNLLLAVGLIYLAYRMIHRRGGASLKSSREMTHYEKLRSVEPGPYARPPQDQLEEKPQAEQRRPGS